MIDQVCREITKIIPWMFLDDYQIMPNYFHGIIMIDPSVGATLCGRPGQTRRSAPTADNVSLSNFVQRFKSLTTYRYIEGVKKNYWPRFDGHLWQKNYYEHIIRSSRDHQAIVDYIFCNPQNWEKTRNIPIEINGVKNPGDYKGSPLTKNVFSQVHVIQGKDR